LYCLPACLTLSVGSKEKENADLPTGINRRNDQGGRLYAKVYVGRQGVNAGSWDALAGLKEAIERRRECLAFLDGETQAPRRIKV
jgi:hypothetical protein